MNAQAKPQPMPIRLVFELTRSDHPHLYDDLIQFRQGTKRVNRLRVLAYDGLLVHSGLFVAANRASPHPLSNSAEEGSGDVTNDLFAPSLES
jgi:hypothetical protein